LALTVKRIERLTEPGTYLDGRIGGGVAGLYLKVNTATSRSWLLRYEQAGRERWMGLGPVSEVTLVQARNAAKIAREQLRQGIDPINARRDAKAERLSQNASSRTFAEAAEQYFNFHSAMWRSSKHQHNFLASLKNYAYPTIGKLPVDKIDRALVLRILEPIWQTKSETASRVRGRIENVLDYARVQNWRSGENPAAWAGNLEHALPATGKITKVRHHAALPWADMPAFIVELPHRNALHRYGVRKRTSESITTDEFILDRPRHNRIALCHPGIDPNVPQRNDGRPQRLAGRDLRMDCHLLPSDGLVDTVGPTWTGSSCTTSSRRWRSAASAPANHFRSGSHNRR
jgi:hypothetical protein